MTTFTYFITALRAEFLKKKHTGTYFLCFLLSILMPVTYFVILISKADLTRTGTQIPYNYYEDFVLKLVETFGQFFLPLIIIITAARITQIDHKNGGWQLMETQPLSRLSIYLSKYGMLLIGNILAIMSFLGISVLLTWFLLLFKEVPEVATKTLPAYYLFQLGIRLFVSSLYLSAVVLVVSILFKNFILPIVIGFLTLIASLILDSLGISSPWNPFALMSLTGEYSYGSNVGHFLLYTEKLALVGFLIFGGLGFIYYQNKTYKKRFSQWKVLTPVLAILVLGYGTMAWMIKPNHLEPHPSTILSGRIDSDQDISEVFLVDKFLQDTLASIPVIGQEFSGRIKSDIPLSEYYLAFKATNQIIKDISFGTGDSLFIELEDFGGENRIKTLTGTRLAENQYVQISPNLYPPGYLTNMINIPDYFDDYQPIVNRMFAEWKDQQKEVKKFVTRDNIRPRPDFIEGTQKIVSARYLNLWNDFLDNMNTQHPELIQKPPEKISKIKATLGLQEESLLVNRDYVTYVLNEITRDDHSDIDFLTKEMRAISRLEDGVFKDRLLFAAVRKGLEHNPEAADRERIITEFASKIQNPKLYRSAQYYFQTLNRLGKGSPAPDFIAETLDGNTIALSDFRDKKVILDVWATWCGPCLYQAPYFERVAIRHKEEENLVFIALSVDENADKWKLKAQGKTQSVLQLHLSEEEVNKFEKAYALNGIPRYIMIDEEGNFIDSEMPFPSGNRFQILINENLKK